MKKTQSIAVLLLITVVLVSGCTQQEEEMNEVRIAGHPVYVFSNDVRAALAFPSSDPWDIQRAVLSEDRMTILYNGSSAEDNTYFQVVLYNIVSKIQTYFVYNGKVMHFDAYYFINNTWYNSTAEPALPLPSGVILSIRGPDTGAEENSLVLDSKRLYIQGTTYKNLTLAGDRLVLAVLGVTDV